MNLNDKTTIPLWTVIVSVPIAAGMIAWFVTVANLTNANANDIKDMKSEQRLLYEIREDVAVIRERVNALYKQSK